MKVIDLERTLELLHEHINGLDRAWGHADGLFRAELERKIEKLRGLVIRLQNVFMELIDETSEVNGFDWSHLGNNDMSLLDRLWKQHLASINDAAEAGDFLTERVLAEMRDEVNECWGRVCRSWDLRAMR